MGLTKIGQAFARDLEQLKNLGRFGKKIFLTNESWTAQKAKGALKLPFRAAGSIGRKGLVAAGALGRQAVKHPKAALIGGTGATYLGATLPGRVTANLAHTDPTQHSTYASGLTQGIVPINKDPKALSNVRRQNRFF